MAGFEKFLNRVTTNIGPAVLENLDRSTPPPEVERRGEAAKESAALVEKLLPAELQEHLRSRIGNMTPGRYRARDVAGDPKIGTRHLHDFVIDSSTPGEIRLFIVDPEHALGKNKNRGLLPRRGDIRPKVCILYAARMKEDGGTPDLSILRYRSKAITDPHLLKMDAQLRVAEQLLDDGDIPELLKGKEHEVTFRLNVRPDALLAQSRLASEADLNRLLDGAPTAPAPEGQLHRFKVFMNYFRRHLNKEKDGVQFEPLPATPAQD